MPHRIANPAVSTAIDVALWFLERARAADAHLPAQKLQNLLYLSFIAYEREHGAMLMPAVFVRNDISVVEPNVYRLFEDGRPGVRGESVPLAVQPFLEIIWSRYAHYRVAQLNEVVLRAMDGHDEGPGAGTSLRGRETLGAKARDVRPTHRGRHVALRRGDHRRLRSKPRRRGVGNPRLGRSAWFSGLFLMFLGRNRRYPPSGLKIHRRSKMPSLGESGFCSSA